MEIELELEREKLQTPTTTTHNKQQQQHNLLCGGSFLHIISSNSLLFLSQISHTNIPIAHTKNLILFHNGKFGTFRMWNQTTNQNIPKPTRNSSSNPIKINKIKPSLRVSYCSSISKSFGSRNEKWKLKVSAPSRVFSPLEEEDDNVGEFDAGAPPPFKLVDIKNAIPKHCWIKNPWKSMSYVVRDVVVVFGLAFAAASLNSWIVWPLYWLAQDSGHGSFSSNLNLNSVVGHILHSSILVPYHGWISHRTHHQNHGHVENDVSWHPLPERIYNSMDNLAKIVRFSLPLPMLAYPFYLYGRSPGKKGSHFHPDSDLFTANERKDVITSTVCWSAMAALLAGFTSISSLAEISFLSK